ncbi:MAG TPA: hypothetical protein HA230_04665 [Candidatus Aenigmarchaeota archaeon]|nr:hypothetical protein [Candidatus Aenigmarchaeota archaeon]
MNKIAAIVAAGIVYAVISMVVNTLWAFIDMPYYLMQEYFAVWSKLMMSTAGPPGVEFYVASFVFTLVAGLIFAGVYSRVKASIRDKGIRKGLRFGFGIFLISVIPGMFSLYLLINLPTMLIVSWTVSGLVTSLLGGIVIERLVR